MINRLPPPETFAVGAERVRCLCALYNASQSSGPRTTLRNAQVGGHENSKHQISWGGVGWDLVPDRLADMPRLSQAARLLGFWVEVEEDHVHLQSIRPGPAVEQAGPGSV